MKAVVAQLVEHAHGKGEVIGSIPINGSSFEEKDTENKNQEASRYSSVAEHCFRKAGTWVRFPLSAPKICKKRGGNLPPFLQICYTVNTEEDLHQSHYQL